MPGQNLRKGENLKDKVFKALATLSHLYIWVQQLKN